MNVSSGKKPKTHPHLVVCYICKSWIMLKIKSINK